MLDSVNEINLSQKVLPAAGALNPHRIQNFLFSRLRNCGSVKVIALLGLVALELLQLLLIEAP